MAQELDPQIKVIPATADRPTVSKTAIRAALLAQAAPNPTPSQYEVTVNSQFDSLLSLSNGPTYRIPANKPQNAGQNLTHYVGVNTQTFAILRSLLDSRGTEIPAHERKEFESLLSNPERMKKVDIVGGYVTDRWGSSAIAGALARFGQESSQSTETRDLLFIITTNERSKDRLNFAAKIGKSELTLAQKFLLNFADGELQDIVKKFQPLVKLFAGNKFSNIVNEDRLTAVTFLQMKPNSVNATSAKELELAIITSLQQAHIKYPDKSQSKIK